MGMLRTKGICLGMAGLCLTLSVTGCSSKTDWDATVLKVGEESVSLGVANFYARMQQGQYETYYASYMGTTAEEMWEMEVDEGVTYEDSMKENLLESLEDLYLLRQHAADYEVSLSEEEEAKIAKAVASFDENNTLEGKAVVAGYEAYITEFLELMTIQTKMEAAIGAEVDAEIPDEEVAQKAMEYVYVNYTETDEEGNSEELSDDEKETWKQTVQGLIDTMQADASASMETLATELGLEYTTATFDSESTSIVDDLLAVVDLFEEEGQMTELIETEDGLYVGRLTSLLDREATDSKKEEVLAERQSEHYEETLDTWREETTITLYKSVWKKVKFEKQGITIIESPEEYTSENEVEVEEVEVVDETTDATESEETEGVTEDSTQAGDVEGEDAGVSEEE
jgi:hypothetical protein